MDLPITLPVIILISAFSIYYDIKERRIPNWIIFYGFLFLTLLYIYITIFYESSFLFYQLYYLAQFFFFLFIIYLFMKINPGDFKIFLLVSYAFPYFYIEYRAVGQIPFLSIFINFSVLSLVYFFSSINLDIWKRKWKKMLITYLNMLTYLIVIITITIIIMTASRALLKYSIFAGILLVMLIIRILSYVLKKFEKKISLVFYPLSALCIAFLIYRNYLYNLIAFFIILLITSIYISVRDEEALKKSSIPLSVFIVLSIILTIFLKGDLITFLRYKLR